MKGNEREFQTSLRLSSKSGGVTVNFRGAGISRQVY